MPDRSVEDDSGRNRLQCGPACRCRLSLFGSQGTDVDHDDTGKRRLRSNSGKDPEVALLSDPMTEVATEQMSVPRRRQQDGDQKVHSFDPEANLCKQKQPQFTVEELGAEQHKLIGRKLKRF